MTFALRRIRFMSAAPQRVAGDVARRGASMRGLPTQEKLFVCLVFAVTGSSAAFLVRQALGHCRTQPALQSALGIDENSGFINGPGTYRALYFFIMWPAYSALLVFYGTLFGRREFFSQFVIKMWSRFLPRGAVDKLRRALKVKE